MDYPGGYDRLPTDDKYMPQIPFGGEEILSSNALTKALRVHTHVDCSQAKFHTHYTIFVTCEVRIFFIK